MISLTFLPRLEMAHPARDPAAPAAEVTKVAGAGAIPLALSAPLVTAVSGFERDINNWNYKVRKGNKVTHHVRYVFFQLFNEELQGFEGLITDQSIQALYRISWFIQGTDLLFFVN